MISLLDGESWMDVVVVVFVVVVVVVVVAEMSPKDV